MIRGAGAGHAFDMLLLALREPAAAADFDLAQWDQVVRVARYAGILGRLAWLLERDGLLQRVPEAPRAHLRWDHLRARACARDVRYEVGVIAETLAEAQVEAVLLKGAAYVCGDFDAAGGRFFRDIDILVPERSLDQAERALMRCGWVPQAMNPYDQRYYREWMHEIPPMKHIRRGTVVDVHFNILPKVGRLQPDSDLLLAGALRPAGDAAMPPTLSLPDLILHSSAHLFQNGEFDNALRDLSDLDLLLRQYAAQSGKGAWGALEERAVSLDLSGPLYLALALCADLLATPIPPDMVGRTGEDAHQGALRRRLLRDAFRRAVRPSHRLTDERSARLARLALFIRSHWIRMPPLMLVRHLTRKWLREHLEARG